MSKAKIKRKFKRPLQPETLKKIPTPKKIEKEYIKSLQDYTNTILNSLEWWTNATLKKNKDKNLAKQLQFNFNDLYDTWDSKTAKFAKQQSRTLTNKIARFVNGRMKEQNPDFRFLNIPKKLKQSMQAIQDRNYNLIRSIPKEIIERFQSTYLNNVNNLNEDILAKQLKTIKGISLRRAKTIGRDQVQKASTEYNSGYEQSLGFEYYVWITARDERVSVGLGGHKYLDNRIYKYSEPTAVIDSYKNLGVPSQRVNCRCKAVSINIKANQEVKKVRDSLRGDYYVLLEK